MGWLLALWNNTAVQATVIAAASHVVVWVIGKIPGSSGNGVVNLKDSVLSGLAGILQKGVSTHNGAIAPGSPPGPTYNGPTSTAQVRQPEPVSTADVLTPEEKKALSFEAEPHINPPKVSTPIVPIVK